MQTNHLSLLWRGFCGSYTVLCCLCAIAIAEERAIIPAFVFFPNEAMSYTELEHTVVYCEDRYGRSLARIEDGEGNWLQAEWVQTGRAVVYAPQCADEEAVKKLFLLEAEAREHKHGIWAEDELTVSHEQADQHYGSFRRVGGVVKHVAVTKYGTYINFGEDWKTDFTGYVPKQSVALFSAEMLENLKDQFIYVRGPVYVYHGPRITLFHPSQLEIQDDANR